jgi:hypothetical protein
VDACIPIVGARIASHAYPHSPRRNATFARSTARRERLRPHPEASDLDFAVIRAPFPKIRTRISILRARTALVRTGIRLARK